MQAVLIPDMPVIANPRFQQFADFYLANGNAAKSAREAGYSHKTSSVRGAQILRKPDVASYIAWHREHASQVAGITKAEILAELKNIALSNVADYTTLDADGNLQVDFSGATREQLAAVSSVKTKTRSVYNPRGEVIATEKQSEFRLWDKLRATELLGKDMGMFAEAEQRVVIDVADRLLSARERVMKSALAAPRSGDEAING